jgi:hypothetical protein
MKIRVVSSRDDIMDLNPGEEILHITFRPSHEDIYDIIDACPKITAIQIPPSYKKTIGKAVKRLLLMKRIELLQGDIWGHRSDLNEHYEVPDCIKEMVVDMLIKGKSDTVIIEEINQKYKLNPELAKLLIKELRE